LLKGKGPLANKFDSVLPLVVLNEFGNNRNPMREIVQRVGERVKHRAKTLGPRQVLHKHSKVHPMHVMAEIEQREDLRGTRGNKPPKELKPINTDGFPEIV